MPTKQNSQQRRSRQNGGQKTRTATEKVVVNVDRPQKVRTNNRFPRNSSQLGKMIVAPKVRMPSRRDIIVKAISSLCLPGSHPAPGLPSKFGSSNTSTAAPKRIGNLTTTNVPGFGGLNNQSWFAVSRNPLLSTMYTQRGCPSFRYDATYSSTTSINDEPVLQSFLQFELPNVDDVAYASATLSPDPFSQIYSAFPGLPPTASMVAPYGNESYCLNALGHRWFFNGAGCPVTIHALVRNAAGVPIEPATPGTSQAIQIFQLTGPDTQTPTGAMTFIDGEVGWQDELTERGWYRFEVLFTALAEYMTTNGTQFTFKSWVTTAGNSTSWSIVTAPLPELVKETSVHSLRITGASMLLTNTTPQINKGGFFRTMQFQPKDDFMTFIDSDAPLDYLAEIQGPSDPHSFVNGAYAWMRPGNIESYEMQNIFARDTTGKVFGHNVPVFHPSGWLVTVIDGPAETQTVSTTASFSIEFFSRSYWYGPVTERLTTPQWDEVVDEMYHIRQVTENALHLKEIGSSILNIARGLTPALPFVAKALSAFHPTAGAVLGAVSDVINKRESRRRKKLEG